MTLTNNYIRREIKLKKKLIVMLAVMGLSAMGTAGFCVRAEENESETSQTEITEETSNENETTFQVGIWPEIAGESGITYDNLFEVILDEDCYDYWYEYCAEAVGEEEAEATVEMLQGFISSDLYGEEAVEAYADADSFSFDCWYINDAKSFTFSYNNSARFLTAMYTRVRMRQGNSHISFSGMIPWKKPTISSSGMAVTWKNCRAI